MRVLYELLLGGMDAWAAIVTMATIALCMYGVVVIIRHQAVVSAGLLWLIAWASLYFAVPYVTTKQLDYENAMDQYYTHVSNGYPGWFEPLKIVLMTAGIIALCVGTIRRLRQSNGYTG